MDQVPLPIELVNLAGIAEMAQVKRPAVSNWRRRYEDFPAPVGEAAGAILFEQPEIERWLQRHGKPYEQPSLESRIWNALAALRDQVDPDALLSAAFELVGSMTRDSTDAPDRRTAGSTAAAGFLGLVRHLALVHGPGDVVEALIAAKGRGGRAAWEYITPPSIVRLLATLAKPIAGIVHDPACGMGGLLLAASRSAQPDALMMVTGVERMASVRHIAALRLAAHGVEARVELGDTLADPPPALLADIVLTDPPWRQAWRPSVDGGRWFAGVPVASDADMAWLQESINRLSPSGRAFHVSPGRPLFAGGRNGAIRRQLVARGCVHAIIQLPAGLYHPTTAIGAFVWILSRPRIEPPGDVLFVDASQVGHRVGGRTELSDSDVAAIAVSYRSWAQGRSPQGAALPVRAVPAATLLADENCDLSPNVWLPQEQNKGTNVGQLRLAADHLAAAWRNLLADGAPSLDVEQLALDVPRVTVRELIKADLVEMIRSRRLQDIAGTGRTSLITARDLRRDWTVAATKSVDPDLLPDDANLTQPGDVLIATSGSLRAAVDDVGGAAVAAPVHILRCRQDQLDPLVLAALLTSTRSRDRDRGSVLMYRDLLDMELPLLDLASQQQLAERLRVLRRLRHRADDLVRSTDSATQMLVDVVATGTFLRPPDGEPRGRRP